MLPRGAAMDSLNQSYYARCCQTVAVSFLSFILCGSIFAQTLQLPPRPVDAQTGSQFYQTIASATLTDRESRIFQQISSGNIPDFLRKLVAIKHSAAVGGVSRTVEYYVTPDYLAVGNDSDYFRLPMSAPLAQKIANALNCTLPTKRMVDSIYKAAPVKLVPITIAWANENVTVPVFFRHDSMIQAQRNPLLVTHPLGTLVAGTKKDIILSRKIYEGLKANVPKPVVIYGWHKLDGTVWQPVYNGHTETYMDYSHGIRLVQQKAMLGSDSTTIGKILTDTVLSALLSDEGVIPKPYYGSPTYVEIGTGAHPESFELFQNYPNPFNASTLFRFRIIQQEVVSLDVFDLLGRKTATVFHGEVEPGEYSVSWDASSFESGTYFFRLMGVNGSITKKLVLVK
jgi:hypothetical protein